MSHRVILLLMILTKITSSKIDYYGYRFPLNGHPRDAFINGALDCDLALDIWKTITLEKTSLGMRDDLSLTVIPLKSMTVEVLGAGRFYWPCDHTQSRLMIPGKLRYRFQETPCYDERLTPKFSNGYL
jgi:hypothetical protein